MRARNPYAISFGRIPAQYISRDVLIETILDDLNSDPVESQAFKLTGIRGTGKTVTLTAIEKRLREDDGWIVIDLKSNSSITADLVANLYSEVPFLTEFIDARLNLSLFGIGVNISRNKATVSIDAALKHILKEVQRRKKKLLVAIDELRKTDAVVDFIQEFQILIREELPIYLIAAGLYEDIESVENTDGLTFFLRAETYEMTPLSIPIIRENYRKVLGLSYDQAQTAASMTKGYAFAYQAFGKYIWESEEKELTDLVLAQVDEALSKKVYDKIWCELTPKDRWYLEFIVQKDSMSASELLEITKTTHSQWSEPRRRLIEKGVLDGSIRGMITLRLPRFKEYTERQSEAN